MYGAPSIDFYTVIQLAMSNGMSTPLKMWLYNMQLTGKPEMSSETDKDKPTFGNITYPFKLLGRPQLDTTTSAPILDDGGNPKVAYIASATKEMANFATFGDTVYQPAMGA